MTPSKIDEIEQNGPSPEEGYLSNFASVLSGPRTEHQPRAGQSLFKAGEVVIIGELNIPQCKKYRVIQKLEVLELMGLTCSYSYWNDVPRALSLLQTASVALFYRVQWNSTIQALYMEAKRLGLPIGYDIDDPMFDFETCRSNQNFNFLPSDERVRFLADCDRHLRAMLASDFLTISTPGLIELARKHFAGPILLWRNGLDHETERVADYAARNPSLDMPGSIEICYVSGSRAHEADFRVCESALVTVLTANSGVRLSIIGHLNPPPSLAAFDNRIKVYPFKSYEVCLTMMAQSQIHIVPLELNSFNHSKSCVRYLDATSIGLPTIASAAGDYANIIANRAVGLLSQRNDDWAQLLSSLVESPELRMKVASAASNFVRKTFSCAAIARELKVAFGELTGQSSRACHQSGDSQIT